VQLPEVEECLPTFFFFLQLLLGASHALQKHEVPEPLQKHIKKPAILRLVNKDQKRQPVILILDRVGICSFTVQSIGHLQTIAN
jgi:hypothetical protein